MSTDLESSLKNFNNAISKFSRKLISEDLVTFHKTIALLVLRGVVLKTPVDTGRARGNWQVTINNQAEGEVDPRDSISAGQQQLASIKPFDVVWISNNVPYIEFLEEGSSTQAPEGMLALTLEEITRIFP